MMLIDRKNLKIWVKAFPFIVVFFSFSAILITISVFDYFALPYQTTTDKIELLEITFIISTIIALLGYLVLSYIASKLRKQINQYEKDLAASTKELKEKNRRLHEKLYVEPLTGLGNRKALLRDIQKLNEPKLIVIDIDEFGKMNDYFGSEIGDYILEYMAKELKKFADKNGFELYKISADQFSLLEDGILDVERYESIASELIKEYKGRMIELPNREEEIELHCTIGFSLESEDIFEKAIVALKQAKIRGRDYLCYFRNIDNSDEYGEQIAWSNKIKKALENDQIIPFYQPIFDRDRNVVKYECLVRIINEKSESVSPGLFISTSKVVKRYSEIEKILIQKSFEAISGTKKNVSLNLLARDMMDSDVSNFVIDCINKYDVSKQLVIEVLEDENIENIERISWFIERVKRMGVRIAIDDFGTGYSNFSYLLKLKPDYIKIDGSLIKDIDKDANSKAIVNAIIVFAKKLGIKVIAEYVRSRKVYETCYELGVDEFQGFYLGEPRPTFLEE